MPMKTLYVARQPPLGPNNPEPIEEPPFIPPDGPGTIEEPEPDVPAPIKGPPPGGPEPPSMSSQNSERIPRFPEKASNWRSGAAVFFQDHINKEDHEDVQDKARRTRVSHGRDPHWLLEHKEIARRF
jgi:hypothetical protein